MYHYLPIPRGTSIIHHFTLLALQLTNPLIPKPPPMLERSLGTITPVSSVRGNALKSCDPYLISAHIVVGHALPRTPPRFDIDLNR